MISLSSSPSTTDDLTSDDGCTSQIDPFSDAERMTCETYNVNNWSRGFLPIQNNVSDELSYLAGNLANSPTDENQIQPTICLTGALPDDTLSTQFPEFFPFHTPNQITPPSPSLKNDYFFGPTSPIILKAMSQETLQVERLYKAKQHDDLDKRIEELDKFYFDQHDIAEKALRDTPQQDRKRHGSSYTKKARQAAKRDFKVREALRAKLTKTINSNDSSPLNSLTMKKRNRKISAPPVQSTKPSIKPRRSQSGNFMKDDFDPINSTTPQMSLTNLISLLPKVDRPELGELNGKMPRPGIVTANPRRRRKGQIISAEELAKDEEIRKLKSVQSARDCRQRKKKYIARLELAIQQHEERDSTAQILISNLQKKIAELEST